MDRKVTVFQRSSSSPIMSYTTGGYVDTVDISADGKYVVAGSDDDKVYLFYDAAVPVLDPDGDGVSTGVEYIFGSNPNLLDSDGDGFFDGTEILNFYTDPTDADSNQNGIPDNQEHWTATWGGIGEEIARKIERPSDAIYQTGWTSSAGAGGFDAILVKYDLCGNPLWHRTWGGANDDRAFDITIDGSGMIYITGWTASFGGGNRDVFVVKYDSAGVQQWNKTWGGTSDDEAEALIVDMSGNIYVTGNTISYSVGGYRDAFLLKYDSAGTQLWYRTWGGTQADVGHHLSVDESGYIYVTGKEASFGGGLYDIFILKYDPSGNRLWNKTWGAEKDEFGFAIAVTSSNIFIAGCITPVISNATNYWDGLLLCLDTNGNPIWHRIFNGSANEQFNAIIVQGSDIILAGQTQSYNEPYWDAVLCRFNSVGVRLGISIWGGKHNDYANDLLILNNSVYISGGTVSYGSGNWDAFLARLTTPSPPRNLIIVNGDNHANLSWNIPASNGGLEILGYDLCWSTDNATFTKINLENVTMYKHLNFSPSLNYYYKISALNLIGEGDNSSTAFFKETVAPVLTIPFPTNGTVYSAPFAFQANVFDVNYANVTYQVDSLPARLCARNASVIIDADVWAALGDGAHQVTIVAKDLMENAAYGYINFVKDTVPPAITIPFPTNGTAFNSTFYFRADVFDANFAYINYQVDARVPHVFTRNASTLIDASDWAAMGQGAHQITIQAIDLAGNSRVAYIAFVKDTVAPSTGLAYNPPSNPDFIVPATTFTLTGGDPGGSGVAATYYQLNGTGLALYTAPFSPSTFGNGTLLIQYYSIDNAGNIEPVITLKVFIDTIAPNTTLSVPSFPGNFVNGTTTFTLTAKDNVGGSGIWLTEYRIDGGSWMAGTSFTIPANGTHTIDYRSMDNVYNVESYGTCIYRVDVIAPNTTLSIATFPPDFVNGTVVFTLGGADNTGGAGLLSREYRIDGGTWIPGDTFSIPANGTHVIDYRSIDNVFNVEPHGTRVVRVDKIAPASSLSFIPSFGTDYVNTTTSFSMASSDNAGGSGIASRYYKIGAGGWMPYTGPFTLGAYPNGTYTISWYSVDNVGNVEAVKSMAVHLDIEGPGIMITSPGNWTYTTSTVGITITSPDPDFDAAWYSIGYVGNGTLIVA
ncbi:MAG: fibronectin type III domain-containing protein, partial [Candidatus Sigynarchaeota archaeon]